MLWENWITSFGVAIGSTNITQAAMFFAFALLTTIDLLVIVAASRSRQLAFIIVVIDTILSIFETYAGWFPAFTGVIIALVFALLGTYIIRDTVSKT